MSSAVLSFFAGIIFAVTSIISSSCAMVPSHSERSTPNRSPDTRANSQKPQSKERVAIPDIEGCPRDQTTFYKGKVLSFNRQDSNVEITIRTEWDTTENLTQANADNSIDFRLKGQPLKHEQWKEIDLLLSDRAKPLTATVWVCEVGGKNQIKIIDWQPPASK